MRHDLIKVGVHIELKSAGHRELSVTLRAFYVL